MSSKKFDFWQTQDMDWLQLCWLDKTMNLKMRHRRPSTWIGELLVVLLSGKWMVVNFCTLAIAGSCVTFSKSAWETNPFAWNVHCISGSFCWPRSCLASGLCIPVCPKTLVLAVFWPALAQKLQIVEVWGGQNKTDPGIISDLFYVNLWLPICMLFSYILSHYAFPLCANMLMSVVFYI